MKTLEMKRKIRGIKFYLGNLLTPPGKHTFKEELIFWTIMALIAISGW
jgi:hypothetical protein